MVKTKIPSKKYLLIAILVIALLIVGVILYSKSRSNSSQPPQPITQPQELINLNPPTEEDAQRAAENKNKVAAREELEKNQPPQQPGTIRTVKPVITYAGQFDSSVEVGAYVDIFEEGGKCTATFTQGSNKIEKSVTAVRGASSVDCPVMSANVSEFSSKGSWSVVVSYSSATASGTSDARQIEIK